MYFQASSPVHRAVGRDGSGPAPAPGVKREAWLYAPSSETCCAIATGAAQEGLDAVPLRSREQLDARSAEAGRCALMVFALEMEAHPAAFLSQLRRRIGPNVPVLLHGRATDVACLPALVQPDRTDFVLPGAGAVEVAMRLRRLLDRVPKAQVPDRFGAGPYVVHPARNAIACDGEELAVSPLECALAILLFQNLGQLVLREKLVATVDAQRRRVGVRTSRNADHQMARLRQVLALEAHGYALTAVGDVGYRLDAIAPAAAQRSS